MKYRSFPIKASQAPITGKPEENLLSSIPNVIMPEVNVYDNLVSKELHKDLWEYLISRVWAHAWLPKEGVMQLYRPSDYDDSWYSAYVPRHLNQPRTLFGSDEASIKSQHPLVWQLWNEINAKLNNEYEITGNTEGTVWKDYPCPPTEDPALKQGWRVYANATPHDMLATGGYIHRDSKNLEDTDSVTIIWVANQEWYPSWGGELTFYPEDPTGSTGDHQQFNAAGQQSRGFKIGWADEGKTVSLKPNRLIVYDGRTLHSTAPTKHRFNTEQIRRIVFRARKKNSEFRS
jgi:hypothetical protein